MAKNSHSHLTVTVLALASAAAVGAICAALLITPIVPPTLASGTEPLEVPITMSAFSDPLPVNIVLDTGAAFNIVAPRDGRVTSFACARGGKLTSGGTSLAINDAPTLTLASSTPPWRSLDWGDRGSDVESIRTEMLRLGAPASTPGRLDATDTAAFAALLKKIGADSDGRTIELGSILWAPQDGSVIKSCSITTGESVSAGQMIATLAAQLTRVTVTGLPASMRDGAREIVLDDVRTPVQLVEGSSTQEAVLAAVQAAPSYQRLLLGDGDKTQLTATLALVAPLDVASVPAGSIIGADGGRGCVRAAGKAVPVDILGSQLGQTFISFTDGKVPARIERSPDKATECP